MLVGRDAGGSQEVNADTAELSIEEYGSLHEITDRQAAELCQSIRSRLLNVLSQTGGHLASNLGVVELTVALHRAYDTSHDRLVFDVGHQCYVHKMLTGRDGMMETLRSFGGLSGFPKPSESVHDAFIAGHASNAVSVALGMAKARSNLNQSHHIIALLGDGALTGGLSYEGLSSAGQSGEPMLVILNDNGMSIARNVGGVAKHLARQRLRPNYFRFKKWYRRVLQATPPGRGFYRFTHGLKLAIKAALLPGSMFEEMGFQYMGPVDGHDVQELTALLKQVKTAQGPVLLHVYTVKGKGYEPAEQNPGAFHGTGPFRLEDGTQQTEGTGKSFSAVFGGALLELARHDRRICAITAAMEAGTGLSDFSRELPAQFFDVGIAEGHAVSMAAGMAKQGLIPVFAVYSTFLQRGYDMLIHDVAIQKLHVIFCVDRAGFVGDDGETHHGMFDVAFLRSVPGMTVLCPGSYAELSGMLHTAIKRLDGPVAIRYPRGGKEAYQQDHSQGAAVRLRQGVDITLTAYGTTTHLALEMAQVLAQEGIEAEVIKLNCIAPLDTAMIAESVSKTGRLLVVEEVVRMGCVGEQLLADLSQRGVSPKAVALCNCGEGFVPHGSVELLQKRCGLDIETLVRRAKEVCASGE